VYTGWIKIVPLLRIFTLETTTYEIFLHLVTWCEFSGCRDVLVLELDVWEFSTVIGGHQYWTLYRRCLISVLSFHSDIGSLWYRTELRYRILDWLILYKFSQYRTNPVSDNYHKNYPNSIIGYRILLGMLFRYGSYPLVRYWNCFYGARSGIGMCG
jgi:hypothetical protein